MTSEQELIAAVRPRAEGTPCALQESDVPVLVIVVLLLVLL